MPFDSCNLTDTLCHHIMTVCTLLSCNCKWINGKQINGKKDEIQLTLFKRGCWGIYLDPGGLKLQETVGDGTLKRLMIHTPCQILFRLSYQEEQCVLMCGVDGVGAYCGLWWGMNQLIALGIDERVILNGYARNGSCLD